MSTETSTSSSRGLFSTDLLNLPGDRSLPSRSTPKQTQLPALESLSPIYKTTFNTSWIVASDHSHPTRDLQSSLESANVKPKDVTEDAEPLEYPTHRLPIGDSLAVSRPDSGPTSGNASRHRSVEGTEVQYTTTLNSHPAASIQSKASKADDSAPKIHNGTAASVAENPIDSSSQLKTEATRRSRGFRGLFSTSSSIPNRDNSQHSSFLPHTKLPPKRSFFKRMMSPEPRSPVKDKSMLPWRAPRLAPKADSAPHSVVKTTISQQTGRPKKSTETSTPSSPTGAVPMAEPYITPSQSLNESAPQRSAEALDSVGDLDLFGMHPHRVRQSSLVNQQAWPPSLRESPGARSSLSNASPGTTMTTSSLCEGDVPSRAPYVTSGYTGYSPPEIPPSFS